MDSAEDRLIARHFRPLATHPGALALSDDAAFLAAPEGHDLVLKTDAIVGGVHFFPDDDAAAIARKALRVNLSDLAAKGARPLGFLLSLAIPAQTGEDWLARFSEGLRDDAQAYACPLLGGDTDRTPGPATVAIFVLGCLPTGTMVRRAGAQAGHRVAVSGTIGDAALGLALRRDPAAARWRLASGQREHLLERYLLPRPRLALADALRAHASAAMDVSDGLVGDLGKLCRVSGVSADIAADGIPLSAAARAVLQTEPQALQTALTGGDDYEIVCTVPPDNWTSFERAAGASGVAVTAIGTVTAGTAAPRFVDSRGQTLTFERDSYSHF